MRWRPTRQLRTRTSRSVRLHRARARWMPSRSCQGRGGGMRLTRRSIHAAAGRARAWVERNQRTIRRAAGSHARGRAVAFDLSRLVAVLSRIQFVHDEPGGHWAETDGREIWLNTWKDWTPELLFWTLAHESLHGTLTCGAHELPEGKEHRVMYDADPRLVE